MYVCIYVYIYLDTTYFKMRLIPKISVTSVVTKLKNSNHYIPIAFLLASFSISKKETIRILLEVIKINLTCNSSLCAHSYNYIYYANGFFRFNHCHISDLKNVKLHYHSYILAIQDINIQKFIYNYNQSHRSSRIINKNHSSKKWQPKVVIDQEEDTIIGVKSAGLKPFLCKFHLSSLFIRLLDSLELTSIQKLLMVMAFKLHIYEKEWNFKYFLTSLKNYNNSNDVADNELIGNSSSVHSSNKDDNINEITEIKSNTYNMIDDSQRTLFDSSNSYIRLNIDDNQNKDTNVDEAIDKVMNIDDEDEDVTKENINEINYLNKKINLTMKSTIEDSQRTLFESNSSENKLTSSSVTYSTKMKTLKVNKSFNISIPPSHRFLTSKINKIFIFLNKLNVLWGNDVFQEHQLAHSINQRITTNGFAEGINKLLKTKFLKVRNNLKLYELIEAIAGQLSFNKDNYYKLSQIDLTDKNKLDYFIQHQIILNYSNGKNNNIETMDLFKIYKSCHSIGNDSLFQFLKVSPLLELYPHRDLIKDLIQKETNALCINDLNILSTSFSSNQREILSKTIKEKLHQKIQKLLVEKNSYFIDDTNSIFHFYENKLSKKYYKKRKNVSFSCYDHHTTKNNQKKTELNSEESLIYKFDQSILFQKIDKISKKAKSALYEGIFYYLLNNVRYLIILRKFSFIKKV